MKLTLRPMQITFLGSYAKLYISRSASTVLNGTDLHLLEIILDKESYQRLIDADLSTPPRIIAALESVNHCIGEYDLSIILDNIVHFLLNYNDPTESAQLNEWLIKIKADYNCHIILVLK